MIFSPNHAKTASGRIRSLEEIARPNSPEKAFFNVLGRVQSNQSKLVTQLQMPRPNLSKEKATDHFFTLASSYLF